MAQITQEEKIEKDLFKKQATAFSKGFDANRVKMQNIVAAFSSRKTEMQWIQVRYRLFQVLALLTGLFGVFLCIVCILMKNSGYLLIVVIPIALLTARYISDSAKEKKCLESMHMLMLEFMNIVKTLETKLKKVKRLCEELREESFGTEREKLMRLELQILELFLVNDGLGQNWMYSSPSADSVGELYRQLDKTFSTLTNIKFSISPFLTQ